MSDELRKYVDEWNRDTLLRLYIEWLGESVELLEHVAEFMPAARSFVAKVKPVLPKEGEDD